MSFQTLNFFHESDNQKSIYEFLSVTKIQIVFQDELVLQVSKVSQYEIYAHSELRVSLDLGVHFVLVLHQYRNS